MSVEPDPARDHVMDRPKTDTAPTRAGVHGANMSPVKNNTGPGTHHHNEDLIDALRNWGAALPTVALACRSCLLRIMLGWSHPWARRKQRPVGRTRR